MRYVIIDRQTQKQVGTSYASRSRARHRADRLDNEYGAYRYSVRESDTDSTRYAMETQRDDGTWRTVHPNYADLRTARVAMQWAQEKGQVARVTCNGQIVSMR